MSSAAFVTGSMGAGAGAGAATGSGTDAVSELILFLLEI